MQPISQQLPSSTSDIPYNKWCDGSARSCSATMGIEVKAPFKSQKHDTRESIRVVRQQTASDHHQTGSSALVPP